MLYNYHTHTHYCDGSSAPEDYCRFAISAGMKHLGFSSHAPVGFDNAWSIKPGFLEKYYSHIRNCGLQFPEIKILAGLEADFIPALSTPFKVFREIGFDYIIGSVHLVKPGNNDGLWFIDGPAAGYDKGLADFFSGEIKTAVKTFFSQTQQMLRTEKPDILGHFDKIKMHNRNRFFLTDEQWYLEEIYNTLEVVQQTSTILEVNTRGIYKGRTKTLFPAENILKRCHELNIPVIISSDAHIPEELMLLGDYAANVLKTVGYNAAMKWSENGWVEYKLA
jgi:histidinol-phosphatase (PHP family)